MPLTDCMTGKQFPVKYLPGKYVPWLFKIHTDKQICRRDRHILCPGDRQICRQTNQMEYRDKGGKLFPENLSAHKISPVIREDLGACACETFYGPTKRFTGLRNVFAGLSLIPCACVYKTFDRPTKRFTGHRRHLSPAPLVPKWGWI